MQTIHPYLVVVIFGGVPESREIAVHKAASEVDEHFAKVPENRNREQDGVPNLVEV